jgi:aspartate aminotransferase-like enzyme
LLIVDAVASIGGHALDIDASGIDVCVIGPQKALGGPAGVSAVSVSARGWAAMREQTAPSSLSLLDLKRNWLDTGRGVLPGMPSAIEFWALEAALDRVEVETLPAIIARHARAARAARAGLRAMGVDLWIADEAEASTLATAVRVPAGVDAGMLIDTARKLGAVVTPGFGVIASQIVRLDHTGQRASIDAVLANVLAYGSALAELGVAVDFDAAERAVMMAG